MKRVIVPLHQETPTSTICVDCIWHGDGMVIGPPPMWAHICRSDGDCMPGDDVKECPDFLEDC